MESRKRLQDLLTGVRGAITRHGRSPEFVVDAPGGAVGLRTAARPADTAADGVAPRPDRRERRHATGASVCRSHVTQGRDVYWADVRWAGVVKEVRRHDFLVARPLRRDVYVPIEAVRMVVDNGIMLSTLEGEIDAHGWPRPPLFGSRSA